MEYLVGAPYPKESNVDSYADDLKQFTKSHRTVVLRIAQETLNILADKTDYLGMTFSPQKCKAICFGMSTPDTNLVIKGIPIQCVSYHMLLGIYIDTHLTFNKHIEYKQERIKKGLML